MKNCKSKAFDNTPVKSFDLARYLGKWHEIARYPNSFERGLEHITATYTMEDNGKVRVENVGYKNGKLHTAIGKAKITDKPGFLRVSFFMNFYADYIVMELDEKEYSYAVIGSSSDKYLWILSRTPDMPQKTLELVFQKLIARGYNPELLLFPK